MTRTSYLSIHFFVSCTMCCTSIAHAEEPELFFPTPNPPFAVNGDTNDTNSTFPTLGGAISQNAATEWTFHKTADGSHPNGVEQQALWLMNRARANPTQEGVFLATASDADVAFGRSYFGVDLAILQSEFAAIAVKPPAAFDNRLYDAAFVHSTDLIARDTQDHNQQFDRVDAEGFHYSSGRGSVFSYASSGLNAHAAWNIDWGPDSPDDGDGMQAGRGHRLATMSVGGNYTNVGIAAIHETNSSTQVGEYVTTGNYCEASTTYANHYNKFIIGTVWEDINNNNQYDPGEGKANVDVNLDQGTYYAVTGDSGGYAIPVTNDATYQVSFSGGDITGNYIKNTTVNGQSVLVDIKVGDDSPVTNQAPTAVDDSITTAFNTTIAIIEVLSNDTDPENDTLSVTNNTNPANGLVVKTGDTFSYTPNTGFSGSDSFSYTISDGNGNSVTATVTIIVNTDTPSQGAFNIIPIITLLLSDE